MDLILWRHAEAGDANGALASSGLDMARELTPRGEKQARRMATWLDRVLPETARIYASPALRCQQTAQALPRKFKTSALLAPLAAPEQVLELTQWPDGKFAVVLIGHQPTLGQVAAKLLGMPEQECAIRKASVWWLRWRERNGVLRAELMAVQAPDFL